METYLSQRGYGILKTDKNEKEIKKIIKELSVSPAVLQSSPFMNTNKEYPIYMESDNKIYIPKCYGLTKYGIPKYDNLSSGLDCPNLIFNGCLRDNQKKPIEDFIKAATNPLKLGGIISVPCGFGKTIMAIYVMCYFKKKTLFISHKDFLNEQFITSIKDFIPNIRIGKIKQKTVDVENKDVVIATLQSLAIKEYDPKIFRDFGLVIIDECHHIASEVFSRAFRKMNIRITLGLSATLNRKDGLRKVFEWYLGKSVYTHKNENKDNNYEMIVQIHKYFSPHKDYSTIKTFYNGQPNLISCINNVCSYKPRTELVVDILISVLKKEPERKVLILSERKNQLKDIEELIKDKYSYGYYIGGMKMSDLDISATKQIILATFQMSSEGLNIPTLNTLVLASPYGDIQQSVGRILREKKEDRKYIPLCIDIYDEIDVFKSKHNKRIKYYNTHGYLIKNYIENTIVNYDELEQQKEITSDIFINDDE